MRKAWTLKKLFYSIKPMVYRRFVEVEKWCIRMELNHEPSDP